MGPMTMSKFLVLTDLHLRDIGETIIDLDPYEKLEMALNHAITNHGDADQIILMGDLTHSGYVTQYQRLKTLLDPIKIPITFLMGNHDQRDNFRTVFPDALFDENGFAQSATHHNDTCIIAMDTLFGPPFVEYAHFGDYCADRFAWLKATLDANTDKRVLLFAHHPAWDIGFPGMDMIRMKKDAELKSLLSNYTNIEHIFAGHVHRTISGNWAGHSFTMFKGTCHQGPMELVSNDLTLSVPEPGAYGIVLMRPDSVIVHSEDFEIALSADGPCPDAVG